MADRTGRALGSLDPVIYFEQMRHDGPTPRGWLLLAPQQIGEGTALARRLFEERFKAQGYAWCEAGTLNEVDKLQGRLVAQETKILQERGLRMDSAREASRRATSSSLRQRMMSAGCSQYERDFIRIWLEMDEEKRKKYTQRWTEYNNYLWAREMDSKTRVEDRMGDG